MQVMVKISDNNFKIYLPYRYTWFLVMKIISDIARPDYEIHVLTFIL